MTGKSTTNLRRRRILCITIRTGSLLLTSVFGRDATCAASEALLGGQAVVTIRKVDVAHACFVNAPIFGQDLTKQLLATPLAPSH